MQRREPGAVVHVLVRAPNWLGDAVMALPALQALRRHFDGATLSLAAVPSVAPLFAEAAGPGRAGVVQLKGPQSAQAQALAAARADVAILMTNSFGSAWVARRARIPERWGYRAAGRRWLLTRAVARPRGRIHQVEYYLALVAGLGIEPDSPVPALALTDATGRRADAMLAERGWDPSRPLVGFAPGAAYGHAKRWPPARVAEVIRRLTTERDVTAALVGAPEDRETRRLPDACRARG
jgi:heptosyltransferase-2